VRLVRDAGAEGNQQRAVAGRSNGHFS
jgi:hypothetical protein